MKTPEQINRRIESLQNLKNELVEDLDKAKNEMEEQSIRSGIIETLMKISQLQWVLKS